MKTELVPLVSATLAAPLLSLTLSYWKWRYVIAMIWQIRRSLLTALIHGGLTPGLLILSAALLAAWLRSRS